MHVYRVTRSVRACDARAPGEECGPEACDDAGSFPVGSGDRAPGEECGPEACALEGHYEQQDIAEEKP